MRYRAWRPGQDYLLKGEVSIASTRLREVGASTTTTAAKFGNTTNKFSSLQSLGIDAFAKRRYQAHFVRFRNGTEYHRTFSQFLL